MLDISIEEYAYSLPDEKIARFPQRERDMSKLLVYDGGKITDTRFADIGKHIPHSSLMVFNNTKVIRARIMFRKKSGAAIEIFCLEPVEPAGYETSFGSRGEAVWKCIAGNLKKWKTGTLATPVAHNGMVYELKAEKARQSADSVDIKFSWPRELTFAQVLEDAGRMPLPPYMGRDDVEEDSARYQTVFASAEGSVAAPTAGLHFSERVIDGLKARGVAFSEITLHVGAGTFQPLKSKNIFEHTMHREHFRVTAKTVRALLQKQGSVIAVGTTSVRTLESLYCTGVKIIENRAGDAFSTGQWEPYAGVCSIPAEASLAAVLKYMEANGLEHIDASTKVMIVPGYRFRIVNGIVTNFHQPGSTLLLLVSAWTGDAWKDIYSHALSNSYRFLSYGDCSLLL
ncbi:MAG: S-adenosylmethionine:tRNA ribosyltransferase-isomerase [Bacteroidales bacterium]|jgi:S-adenosylmethionine:tRNA ribosyltransferase-isomerase|nr:S-adenosylmethionine:tRNA ribosyltransferase-isomerase [Bacteroidales bacterium]